MITREYPADWEEGMEAYYTVNDEKNQRLYQRYAELAEQEKHVILAGVWQSTNITIWIR